MKKIFIFLGILVLILMPSLVRGETIYDLETDWDYFNNPNGQWAYLQGMTVLPHQVGTGSPMPSGVDFFGPGNTWGNFIPLWFKDDDYENGKIVTHSVDSCNGNPALGESILTWTSPSTGIINIEGSIWYAKRHHAVDRSNVWLIFRGRSYHYVRARNVFHRKRERRMRRYLNQ